MIQGNFSCTVSPKTIRFSGSQFCFGVKALVDRIDDMWFAEGKNDFKHHPNFALRALKELHVEFNKKE